MFSLLNWRIVFLGFLFFQFDSLFCTGAGNYEKRKEFRNYNNITINTNYRKRGMNLPSLSKFDFPGDISADDEGSPVGPAASLFRYASVIYPEEEIQPCRALKFFMMLAFALGVFIRQSENFMSEIKLRN